MTYTLSNMHLAREVLRQQVTLEFLARTTLKPDAKRSMKLLGERDDLDVNGVIELMREAFDNRRPRPWSDAFGVLLSVMSGDQHAEFILLNATFTRLADRLADRIRDQARRDAGSPDKIQGETIHIAVGLIETTGAFLEQFRSRAQPKTSLAADVASPWTSRHTLVLTSGAGPDEEQRAYAGADLTPLERAALDRHFAAKLPPMGMLYTFAAVAADMFGRYGCSTRAEMEQAIESAEDVFDHALWGVDATR
ncbi:MAG: hypothetical protein P4L85_19565 [Paludisphaera borealis]|uniref:hypothetical protein n=1 Tax=Paludisphaera borealis TaxID=1387353 RepID=UPI002851435B|nr:hypothetical protein [Paludisphaera borealis]MDR3621559.1 hypothetical protein [Paludisphaera borealis]